jgi:hypothetical protein
MVTTRGMVRAAGVALLVLSGCTLPEYFSVSYWQRDSSGQTAGVNYTRTGGTQTVTFPGGPDAVALQFKNALARLGMSWNISTDMDGVRITSTTRTGKQLTIVLRRDTTTGSEQTHVAMEWSGGGADTQVESELLKLAVTVGRR